MVAYLKQPPPRRFPDSLSENLTELRLPGNGTPGASMLPNALSKFARSARPTNAEHHRILYSFGKCSSRILLQTGQPQPFFLTALFSHPPGGPQVPPLLGLFNCTQVTEQPTLPLFHPPVTAFNAANGAVAAALPAVPTRGKRGDQRIAVGPTAHRRNADGHHNRRSVPNPPGITRVLQLVEMGDQGRWAYLVRHLLSLPASTLRWPCLRSPFVCTSPGSV